MPTDLQWGGRFTTPPDPALSAFGSSLEDDLVLAPFDVAVSQAHVRALAGGNIVTAELAASLVEALTYVSSEIARGQFAAYARRGAFEDVHGAIDARVRELAPEAGAWLHTGRSRNDQVATALALYSADRAGRGRARCSSIARHLLDTAALELEAGTLLAATTHWQPAQPVLFAFWLAAVAESFVRGAERFQHAAAAAMRWCPLGSGAVSGSTLPLDRDAACAQLGFAAPTRNALDAVGSRDALLDAAHAFARAVTDSSRACAELIVWATPAFGYVRLGDASSTGSSLMPQKRNPDTFELVRGGAAELNGLYSGALASLAGLPLSYHRDLQQTKRLGLLVCERGTAMLDVFEIALRDTSFDRARMSEHAGDGFTVATDLADALIRQGVSARDAHARVGAAVRDAERRGMELEIDGLDGPLTPGASVRAKVTSGSTSPGAVQAALSSLRAELDALRA